MVGPSISAFVAAVLLVTLLVQGAATLRADRRLRERAEEDARLKDQFLATVSHELRTPLTAITGWCALLEMSRSPDMLDEGLASIANAARIQSQLVEDLLDTTRVISGHLRLSIADVKLPEIVEKAVASIAPSARERGITIRTEIDDPGALVLRADPARLQQILGNLLSNAAKFTSGGGHIDVSARRSGSNVEITVADDGCGIGPALLPYIFDRFRQGDATAARYGGLGLGLSIVKSLAELHRGSVRVHSNGLGKGATFVVTLPLEVPAEAIASEL